MTKTTETTDRIAAFLTNLYRSDEDSDYYLGNITMLQMLGYNYRYYLEDEGDMSSTAVRVFKAE